MKIGLSGLTSCDVAVNCSEAKTAVFALDADVGATLNN